MLDEAPNTQTVELEVQNTNASDAKLDEAKDESTARAEYKELDNDMKEILSNFFGHNNNNNNIVGDYSLTHENLKQISNSQISKLHRILYLLTDVISVLFGIKMFQLLPFHLFAFGMDVATQKDQSDIPYPALQGVTGFLAPALIVFTIPLIAVVLIIVISSNRMSYNVQDYLRLINSAENVNTQQNSQSSGVDSNLDMADQLQPGQNDQSDKDKSELPDPEYVTIVNSNQEKIKISVHSTVYKKLMDDMSEIRSSRNFFLEAVIVLKCISSFCLLFARLWMFIDIYANVDASWDFAMANIGICGFLVRIMTGFIQAQVSLSEKSIDIGLGTSNNMYFYEYLITNQAFALANVLITSTLFGVCLQSFGNFIDVSWRGDYAWLTCLFCGIYLILLAYCTYSEWTGLDHEKILAKNPTDYKTNKLTMISPVWIKLNQSIFVFHDIAYVRECGKDCGKNGCKDCCKQCKCDECCHGGCVQQFCPCDKDSWINFFISWAVMSSLLIIVQYLASPPAIYRRGFTDMRNENGWINFLLILTIIIWLITMLFIVKIVKWATGYVTVFFIVRIIWTVCLVTPFFMNRIDRGSHKTEVEQETDDKLIGPQIFLVFLIILSPVLWINMIAAMARMFQMPNLHLVLGLTAGSFLAISIKPVALYTGAAPYSLWIGFFLIVDCLIAFTPIYVKTACNKCDRDKNKNNTSEKFMSNRMAMGSGSVSRAEPSDQVSDDPDHNESSIKQHMRNQSGSNKDCKDRFQHMTKNNYLCLDVNRLYLISLIIVWILAFFGILASNIENTDNTINKNDYLDRIYIGSYNLHMGLSRKFEFSLEEMYDEFSSNMGDDIPRIDVLCLQEVGASNWLLGSMDYLDYMSSKFDLPYGSYGSNQAAPNGFNMGILSRYPIESVSRYQMPNEEYDSNAVVIEINGKYFKQNNNIVVTCFHMGTNNFSRNGTIKQVHEFADKYSNENKTFIVIADWNTDMKSHCTASKDKGPKSLREKNVVYCRQLLFNNTQTNPLNPNVDLNEKYDIDNITFNNIDNYTHHENFTEIHYSHLFNEILELYVENNKTIDANGISSVVLDFDILYNKTVTQLKKLKTDGDMKKLLDYGFINDKLIVNSTKLIRYEECNDCSTSNSSCLKSCATSDHLPVIYVLDFV